MHEPPTTARRIIDSLAHPIEPVKKTFAYHSGIIITAVCLVALPLVYFAIIVAIGGLSILHLKYNHTIMSWSIGGGIGFLVKCFCYFGPAIAAITMVVFMAKPLFRKSSSPANTIILTYKDAPGFFDFVSAICKNVGAPKPAQIRLFNEVNAYAELLPGIKGIIMGKLCLTVGLPLISGMNTRALAGIIAHEFGHFAQGAGMRTTNLIRRISNFFFRTVYERDAIDNRIEEAAKNADFRIVLFIQLARLFIFISRFILEKVSYVGLLAGMYTMRQMEFDADRYEARLCGSDQFGKTAETLRSLSIAWGNADQIAAHRYSEEKVLPDNYGTLINYTFNKISPAMVTDIMKSDLEKKTGPLDTHPCDTDRIISALKENTPGIFTIEEDPRFLFAEFEKIAYSCTQQYFASVTESDVAGIALYDSAEYIEYLKEVDKDIEAGTRLFDSVFGMLAPLRLDLPVPDETMLGYPQLRNAVESGRETLRNAGKMVDDMFSHLLDICTGSAALNAGYTIKPDQFGFDSLPNDGGTVSIEHARIRLTNAQTELDSTSIHIKSLIKYFFDSVSTDTLQHEELQAIRQLSMFFGKQCENFLTVSLTNHQLGFLLQQEVIDSPRRDPEL